MPHWYPVYGHPLFADRYGGHAYEPWYRESDDLVWSLTAHPDDDAPRARFRREGQLYYPIGRQEAWFERTGSLVYALDTNPLGSPGRAPWYQVR